MAWWRARPAMAAVLAFACVVATSAKPAPAAVQYRDTELAAPDGRRIPVRLVWRKWRTPLTLAVFSHGANSEPARYDRLSAVLAQRGYLVIAPIHSDSPWHPQRVIDPRASFALRIADMKVALASDTVLVGLTGARIRPGGAVAVGHSYGALISQVLAGARMAKLYPQTEFADPRVRAVVAFSPPGEVRGFVERTGWSKMTQPMLVVTGTADVLPIMAPRWEDHLASYKASPAGKMLLVATGADHYFGNMIGRPERPAPEPAVARAFAAAATVAADFLDHARQKRLPKARTIEARFPGLFAQVRVETGR